MEGEIVVKRLFDYEVVLGTMDSMWDDISEDNAERYTPDLLNELWLGLFKDKEYLGMYRFHSINSILLEGHVFMLPEKRAHSVDCGKIVLDWLCENTEFNKVIVNVPECFPNVINFVKKLGLRKQGENPEAYMKNGKILSLIQYGISRGEINA